MLNEGLQETSMLLIRAAILIILSQNGKTPHWLLVPGGHHLLWFHWAPGCAPGTMGEHTSLIQGIHCVTLRPGIGPKGTYERPGLRTHWRKASLEGLSFSRKCPMTYLSWKPDTSYFSFKLFLEEWSKRFSNH